MVFGRKCPNLRMLTVRKTLFLAASLAFGFALPGFAAQDVTCEAIASAIGGPLAAMSPDPGSSPAWIDNPDARQLLCSWVTQGALKAMQGQPLSDAELADSGQILVQVMLYKDPQAVEELRLQSLRHRVPMPGAPADMWIFALEKQIVAEEQPGLMPPELRRGMVGVTVATMPLLMQVPTSFQPLTKAWSLEAGAAVIAQVERGL